MARGVRASREPDGRSGCCWRDTAVAVFSTPRPAFGYSVLTHEANIDVLWDSSIKPLLRARFPPRRPMSSREARAYAYGGCVIQDLGYYPFGSHFFSNLLHYVRSGDFVRALIRDAQDVNEYAFALGALGPLRGGQRRSSAGRQPRRPADVSEDRGEVRKQRHLRANHPSRHLMVEFAFDVVQVAGGAYAPEAYHQYIGFKVAKPALERAYREIYGVEMKDLFVSEDLAIGTYRHAVATTIPEMTKVAWKKKREQIEQVTPGIDESQVRVQPVAPRLRTGIRHATTRSRTVSRASSGSSTSWCRRSGRSGRSASRCRRRRRSACSSTASSAPGSAFADRSEALRDGRLNLANLESRHRPADGARRVHARRRDLRRTARQARRSPVRGHARRASREHHCLLREPRDERVAALAGK